MEEPAGGEPAGGEPAGGEPAGGEPAGGEPAGGEPAGGEPAGGEPAGGGPAGEFARVDHERRARTGDAETVYAAGKTAAQTVAIVARLRAADTGAILVTRADPETLRALGEAHGADATLDAEARTAVVGPLPDPRGLVLVLTAGTSDLPVAREAVTSARVHGATAELIADVGVAGLHRLLAVRDRLDAADCLVVVAGMEGALPSVVGGLTGVPLVAVPTSVGYGVSAGGFAALAGMLASCAPGVVVVNIDNGYGAGVHAARVARRAATRVGPPAAAG